jgi:serine/threonine-protein kinase
VRAPNAIAARDAQAVRREPPPDPVARQRSPHYRAFLLAGLTAACLVVGAAAALISDDGTNGGRDVTAPRAVSSKPQGSPDTAPDDGRSAAAINNAGYALLPGNPQGALPLLARAVEKFRTEGDTRSLDYAFSLYNYGWALRLAGRPAEAIPLLEERLQISKYKRGIVRKELKTAQGAAASG